MRIRSLFLVAVLSSVACAHGRDATRSGDAASTTAAPVESYGPLAAAPGGAARGATGGATPSTPATLGDPATRGKPTIRVLDAGAEPRRRLRYAFKPGSDEWMRFELKMSVTLSAPGKPSNRIESPVLAMSLRLHGDDLAPDGSIRGTVAVERVEVLGDPKRDPNLAQMQQEAAKLTVARGRFVLSPRGEMTESEIAVPQGTAPVFAETIESLRDGIRSLYTPLPDEPVGKGARWLVGSKQSMPAVVDVRTTVTLVDLDAARAKVEIKSELAALPGQNMAPPGAPANVKMSLESLTGEGSGNAAFGFDKLAREGRSALAVTVNVRAIEERREIPFQTRTEIETTYKPLAGPPPQTQPKK